MRNILLFIFNAFLLINFANAQNIPVATSSSNSSIDKSISDEKGNAIIVWTEISGLSPRLFLQKINANGTLAWTAGGMRPTSGSSFVEYFGDFVADGTGGVVISWTEFSMSGAVLKVQRISSAGAKMWGSEGVTVSAGADIALLSDIIKDSSGNYILAWNSNKDELKTEVYAQKVDGNGNILWASNALVTSNAYESTFFYNGLVSDGNGGALISWTVDDDNAVDKSANGVYTRKMNSDGTFGWLDFVHVVISDFNVQFAVSDNSGGVYVCWGETNNTSYNFYLKRLSSTGTTVFQNTLASGISAVDEDINGVMISDNAGGIVAAWNQVIDGNEGLYAQRFSSSGTKLWGVNGTLLAPAQAKFAGIDAALGDNEALFLFPQGNSTEVNFFAQKLNLSTGTLLFPSGGVAITSSSAKRQYPVVSATATNFIAAWEDFRNAGDDENNGDIYASVIPADGVLSVKLNSFNVSYENNGVKLSWKTLTEKNNLYFQLERSLDGTRFSPIGEVTGHGNTDQITYYQYQDKLIPSGVTQLYYRIKQVDLDGEYSYSDPLNVRVPDLNGRFLVKFYPNPVLEKLTVANGDSSRVIMDLFDISGRKVLAQHRINSQQTTDIDVSFLPQGTYILQLTNGHETVRKKIEKL